MMAKILTGTIYHARYQPTLHEFCYPVWYLMIDAAMPESSLSWAPLLGWNRRSILSLWSKDYLEAGDGALREKLHAWYRKKGITNLPATIMLMTAPRYMGYVFNPVSFYFAFRSDGSFHSLLAEVHNTFGEKHLYLLSALEGASLPVTFSFPKEFFVSPFFPQRGEYTLTVEEFSPTLRLSITLQEVGIKTFYAALICRDRKLTVVELLMTLVQYPFNLLLTMVRIHKEAAFLYIQRKLNFLPKPPPVSDNTVRSKQTFVHRVRLWCMNKFVTRS